MEEKKLELLVRGLEITFNALRYHPSIVEGGVDVTVAYTGIAGHSSYPSLSPGEKVMNSIQCTISEEFLTYKGVVLFCGKVVTKKLHGTFMIFTNGVAVEIKPTDHNLGRGVGYTGIDHLEIGKVFANIAQYIVDNRNDVSTEQIECEFSGCGRKYTF